ncbi:hypothetical protein LTR35_018238 [Friedmanniomyces endolithicus]|nr:hypothetical protein LTR35_018238 [Friedmanniomyces endolithicus]KAK1809232.1 hypothetical protein LTR12_016407 [Friedmanniomyces endolithicus]
MFKKETEAQSETASKAVEGGASVRGGKGAVLLYGNYDQHDGISKDIFGAHLRSEEYVQQDVCDPACCVDGNM